MDKKISGTLDKVLNDTQKVNSQNISTSTSAAPLLGKPDCPHCGGVGFLRVDVPLGHEKFGRLEPCVCRANEIAANARQRLYEMSNLERLSHLTFDNFNRTGNSKAEFVSPQEVASLTEALNIAEEFSNNLNGWFAWFLMKRWGESFGIFAWRFKFGLWKRYKRIHKTGRGCSIRCIASFRDNRFPVIDSIWDSESFVGLRNFALMAGIQSKG